jgi:hypothetical protein
MDSSMSTRQPISNTICYLFLSFCLACNATAGVITISPTTPTVDDADIAMLNSVGQFDPGGNDGHIWSNRPVQGQTFTTGSNSSGYTLNSITLQNEENTVNNNTATFTARIGTISGTTFSLVASETSNNSISYVPDDYITFVFDTPVQLDPDTVYGFDWATSGSGFTTWANANSNYLGGEGFSSGSNGTPNDASLQFRGIDRIFHVDLATNLAVPEPTAVAHWSLLGIGLVSYRRWRSR